MQATPKIIREWLIENGHPVAKTGRISAANQKLFYDANPEYGKQIQFVDQTAEIQQTYAPEEAAALPRPSARKVSPPTLQGSSELSYDTVAQTIPSFGGSSAAPPEPDTHVDNRLRIELFWPDPLTPSEERRWIFIDLSQNYA